MADDDRGLRVNGRLTIPWAELDVRATTSGGPGGQHANKAATRIEVRFDVDESTSLTDWQRARIVDRLGSPVRVVADDERSQARNRALAFERLAARVAGALKVERPRRATRPTKASKQRRLDTKARRSETKRARRPPRTDDQ